MRRLFSVFLLPLVFFIVTFLVHIEDAMAEEIIQKPCNTVISLQPEPKVFNSKVIAYYFHGTHRCSTCLAIERYSREAIEKYFTKELREGKLEFKPINVEKQENRHFVKDYQLYTRSLIITLHKGDKQMKWKNLTEVWFYVRDKEKFFQYIKEEVEKLLQEIE